MAKIGYARVSTRDQHEESQLDILEAEGCDRIFVDKVSGKLASRPEWDNCQEYLRSGDALVITRLARLARSVRHLTAVSAQFEERGIDLVVLKQHIDTRTPTGRLMFHIMGAFDEFLADLISEGTKEGLASAKARGRDGGRRPALTPEQVALARQLVDGGEMTKAQIARVIKCARTTLYRHLDPDKDRPQLAVPEAVSA